MESIFKEMGEIDKGKWRNRKLLSLIFYGNTKHNKIRNHLWKNEFWVTNRNEKYRKHYKKKSLRWQFFTINVRYIYEGRLLFIYVIYASVKKSLKVTWHVYIYIYIYIYIC